MNESGSKGQRRREAILQLLKAKGKVSVEEVVDRFGCSVATARRDLDELSRSGSVIRTIGGAQFEPFSTARELSFQEKREWLWLEKEAIAARAAALVAEGDVVGLSGGTTTYLIARQLKERRNITVVTNALNIAMELSDNDELQVVLTGGVLRGKNYELCGPLAEKTVEDLHIGKLFIGVDGLSEHGLTTHAELEARIARMMIGRSHTKVAVFDQTKLGRASLFTIAPLTELNVCITDAPIEGAIAGVLEAHGIETLVADVAAKPQI